MDFIILLLNEHIPNKAEHPKTSKVKNSLKSDYPFPEEATSTTDVGL